MTDLPEPDPIGADRRRNRRRAKLPPGAACVICGVTDIDVLEVHHVLGRAVSRDATVVLCRNCHAQQTGRQHDHQALPHLGRGRGPSSVLERVEAMLASLAQMLHAIAHVIAEYASQLRTFIGTLDRTTPGWRTWPESR